MINAGSTWVGTKETRTSRSHNATRMPRQPPASPVSDDSMRSCVIRRARPAPSDNRIAISLRRAAERASRSPARFVHAMSNTSATIAISARIGASTVSRVSGLRTPRWAG